MDYQVKLQIKFQGLFFFAYFILMMHFFFLGVLNQQLQFANHLSEIYSLQSDHTISPETQQGLDDYSVAMEFCREETMALLVCTYKKKIYHYNSHIYIL